MSLESFPFVINTLASTVAEEILPLAHVRCLEAFETGFRNQAIVELPPYLINLTSDKLICRDAHEMKERCPETIQPWRLCLAIICGHTFPERV